MKKPVVGITLDIETVDTYSQYPWYALRENYASAVYKSGGIPIMLPYALGIEAEYLKLIDGLMITGGNFDIDPKFYSETIKSEKVTTKLIRTQFEFKITELALESKKPILGICGGEQLINVILGGSLIQHIPDNLKSEIEHEQKQPKHIPTHEVKIESGTLLEKIIGLPSFMVNSTHHQAVKVPGKKLLVSAVAPDGIIEAIEHTEHPFCLGVEWHPEYLTTEEDKKILAAFIRACYG